MNKRCDTDAAKLLGFISTFDVLELWGPSLDTHIAFNDFMKRHRDDTHTKELRQRLCALCMVLLHLDIIGYNSDVDAVIEEIDSFFYEFYTGNLKKP